MTTPTDVLDPALASDISDRAFRLFCAITTHPADADDPWVAIPPIAERMRLTPHQVRLPLAELRKANMVVSQRRYETGSTGRKTWHTYVRLVDDAPTEAAA
ncbi:hypothetical protein ACFY1J_04995 [Streptomyces sp. NPDC001406]|uniref:hypothetical protein n=1 Tax=Streptomyces sp. NPDC001406 TaxID=3364572 RepID=UPI0036775E46